eukprot:6009649-Prorocentrum_lima.AAC.1
MRREEEDTEEGREEATETNSNGQEMIDIMAEFHFQPLTPKEEAWTYDQNGKKRTLDYIWERQERGHKEEGIAQKKEAW